MSNKKGNNIILGVVLGILLPLLATFALYYITLYPMGIKDAIARLEARQIHSQILTLMVIPNVAAFFIFIMGNKLQTARGVVLATIIYGVLTIMLKLI